MSSLRAKNSLLSPPVLLSVILLVYAGLWLVYPHEFIASDPWIYSRNAFEIAQGTFFDDPPNHPFAHRLSVTLPTAFFYKLFGISIITTNLWSLCASLLIIVTVYVALPTRRSKTLGVLLCASSVTLFEQSTALLPDIVCASLMAFSALFLFYRHRAPRSRLWWLYPVLATVALFIAFLAKLSAYWVLPLWLYAFLVDLGSKELFPSLIRRFYLPAVVAGVTLGLAYLLVCYQVWNDPLARLTSIQQLTATHLWSWEHACLFDWVKRLAYSPTALFLQDYGIILVFAFFAVWLVPCEYRFWVYYTLLTVLFFWFGSTSFTSYQPLPSITRMTLPALPGLYILAGYSASRVSISSEIPQRTNNLIAFLLVISIAGLPFLGYLDSWRWIARPEANTMRIVQDEVRDKGNHGFLLICSDSRSPESLAFYFGYEYPVNLDVLYAGNLVDRPAGYYHKVFVFLDENRSEFLSISYGFESYNEVIKSLGLPTAYAENRVFLFESSRPHDLLSKLMSSSPSSK